MAEFIVAAPDSRTGQRRSDAAGEFRYATAANASLAIQEAIGDLPAVGGTVCLLPGNYSLATAITIQKSNVRIDLMPGAILKAATGFVGSDGMIVFGDGSTVYTNVGITGPGGFAGALLDCNAAAARAVLFDGPLTQCYARGLEMTDATSTGIVNFVGVSAANPLSFAHAFDLYLHDTAEGVQASKAEDVLFQAITAVTMTSQDCLEFAQVVRGRILGCYLSEPSTSNACIDIFNGCRHIIIIGNHLRGSSNGNNRGIQLDTNTMEKILIANNLIEGALLFGIRSGSGVDDLIITGNQIRDLSDGDSKAIDIRGDRQIISGNILSDVGHNLIVVGGTDIKILDNLLRNSSKTFSGTSSAINMTSTSSRIKIRGNTFLNDQGTPNNLFHIQNPAGVDIIAEGNVSDGNLRAGGKPFQLENDSALIARFNDTTFFVSEASGVATVASGNTTIVVTHGLGYTPAISLIHVTPNENPTNAVNYWISTVTATQFTINVNTDPGASGLDFAWIVHPKV